MINIMNEHDLFAKFTLSLSNEYGFTILLIITILASIFWLWMMIDCLIHEPNYTVENLIEKMIWVLVILLGHFVGALIYFFVRKQKRSQISDPLS